MLGNEKVLQERIFAVYRAMTTRAKPKLWKNGKRSGMVRVAGIDKLPFTKLELWAWAYQWIGPGAMRCPYCEQIGRNAFLISLEDCVFDHKTPLARGGTWELDNLIPCCKDCNNLKGSMSYEFFVLLIREIEKVADVQDRVYLYRCLRTHGQAMSFQSYKNGEKPRAKFSKPADALLFKAPFDDDF